MLKHNGDRIIRWSMFMSLTACLISGCASDSGAGSGTTADRADRLLERTLGVLEKEKPVYKLSTQMMTNGVSVPVLHAADTGMGVASGGIDWKLEEILSRLREAGYAAKLEEDPGNPNVQKLSAVAGSKVWTELVRKDWQATIHSMQTGANEAIETQVSRLKGDQAAQLRAELSASLNTARTRMESMVQSLEAGGVYTISLKRGSTRPDTIVLENQLNYETDGRPINEVIRTTYDFRKTGSTKSR